MPCTAQKRNLVVSFNLNGDVENWRQDGGSYGLEGDTGALDVRMVVVSREVKIFTEKKVSVKLKVFEMA